MDKLKLKSNKGFAGSDALIAVLIITLFAGIIATISYNIYLANSSIKRTSVATSYIVDIFEYVDKTYYDDVTIENLTNYFNNKYYYKEDKTTVKEDAKAKVVANKDTESDVPYNITISIQKYNEIQGNENKLDLVKQINVEVSFKTGTRIQTINMERIKTRENLITPNEPDISLLTKEDNYNYYPIKRNNNEWEVTNTDDTDWYNYEKGNWALVLKTTTNLEQNQKIDINNLKTGEEIFAWIPRYAYNSSNNKLNFLFGNSNKYVEENANGYNILADIETNFTIPSGFSEGEEKTGIWAKDVTVNEYKILNNIYPLKLQ